MFVLFPRSAFVMATPRLIINPEEIHVWTDEALFYSQRLIENMEVFLPLAFFQGLPSLKISGLVLAALVSALPCHLHIFSYSWDPKTTCEMHQVDFLLPGGLSTGEHRVCM